MGLAKRTSINLQRALGGADLKSDTRHWGIDCKDTPRFDTIRYDSEINSLDDTFLKKSYDKVLHNLQVLQGYSSQSRIQKCVVSFQWNLSFYFQTEVNSIVYFLFQFI